MSEYTLTPWLLLEERAYLAAHPERCPDCGHRDIFHRAVSVEGECTGWRCLLEDCPCEEETSPAYRRTRPGGPYAEP